MRKVANRLYYVAEQELEKHDDDSSMYIYIYIGTGPLGSTYTCCYLNAILLVGMHAWDHPLCKLEV